MWHAQRLLVRRRELNLQEPILTTSLLNYDLRALIKADSAAWFGLCPLVRRRTGALTVDSFLTDSTHVG